MSKVPTPWAAVAGVVRRELKARRDELGIPADATVRVTSEGFSGGAAVDVRLSGVDGWAFRLAVAGDDVVRQGYYKPGDRILDEAVRPVGDAVAEVIRVARDAADVGYIWGGVDYDGIVIGSVAQRGWVPGQD